MARPTLLYGSETWVTTTPNMTRLEAAELCFLRSDQGYTRLDKVRSEVIRKKLQISGIQDVRSNHKQNWINHLERTDNTGLPKHALNYKPQEEEIVDVLGNDGNASMTEQAERPNPWTKMMMLMMMMKYIYIFFNRMQRRSYDSSMYRVVENLEVRVPSGE